MEKITSTAALKIAIQQLEDEQVLDEQLLKEQLLITYKELRPASMLLSLLKEIVSPPNAEDNLVRAVTSLATTYLSKEIIIGKSDNPLRKFIGSVLQVGITSIVAQNTNAIEAFSRFLFQQVFHKKK
ncbi:MAG: hypothetical protein P4L28_07515 [Paludibacteraceae bacterium]|nr:hypothetical protein [Paludibacteraceae bacterium]